MDLPDHALLGANGFPADQAHADRSLAFDIRRRSP
jgi:hypothetical protein